jgi:hypothetical protein
MTQEISCDSEKITKAIGLQTFHYLRSEAEKNGVQDLSIDEINEEIRQARCEDTKTKYI